MQSRGFAAAAAYSVVLKCHEIAHAVLQIALSDLLLEGNPAEVQKVA